MVLSGGSYYYAVRSLRKIIGIEFSKLAILPIKRKECGLFYVKVKEEKVDLANLTPEEELKYEIAEELGLLDRVLEDGWKSLSAKETGRIGGLMTRRKRELQKE